MSNANDAGLSGQENNQNAQSSADSIIGDDNMNSGLPLNLGADDDDDLHSGRNVIDLDGDISLEELVNNASRMTPTSAPEPPSAVLTDQIAQLKAQLEQEKLVTLRALADLQNLRRRADEERSRIIRDGNERLIKEILPALDDFERGLSAAAETRSYDQLINGVESVLRKMSETLARQGVEPIVAVGEMFDPDFHEAVSVLDNTGEPEETVVQELRKGYKLHGRVIRPALVAVAKG